MRLLFSTAFLWRTRAPSFHISTPLTMVQCGILFHKNMKCPSVCSGERMVTTKYTLSLSDEAQYLSSVFILVEGRVDRHGTWLVCSSNGTMQWISKTRTDDCISCGQNYRPLF